MDWMKMSRRAMAPVGILAASLAMVSLTACTRDYTLAYMYVTTAKATPGVIDQFTVSLDDLRTAHTGTLEHHFANAVGTPKSSDSREAS